MDLFNNQKPTDIAPAQTVDQQQNEMSQQLQKAYEMAKVFYPDAVERSKRAVATLSAITSIESDEQDEAAEAVLVKSRKTYEMLNKNRLAFTGIWDKEILPRLMAPEKAISTDAKAKDSQYNRVRGLRNDWATKKAAAAEKARQDALRLQAKNDEIARLKGLIMQKCNNAIANNLQILETWFVDWFNGLTLENFDAKVEKAFAAKPAFKRSSYDGYFDQTYNRGVLTEQEYNTLMDELKALCPYDKINDEFVTPAQEIVDKFKAKVPSFKERLQTAANDEAAAAELARQMEQEASEEKQRINEAAANKIAENNAAVENAMRDEQLKNSFNTQIAIQSASADMSGVRKTKVATYIGKPEEVVQAFAQIMFDLFSHDKFAGLVKKDKEGKERFDETGRPVYADWAEELLGLYATLCENKMPEHIKITEVISTIAKSK